MDCRRTVLPALLAAGGLLGCTKDRAAQLAPEVPPPGAKVTKLSELPRKEPSASVCLAYADRWRVGAGDPSVPADRQQEMRERSRLAYQQALEIEPDNLQAHLGLARLFEDRGEHGRAQETYRKALEKHGKNAAVWYELGLSHGRRKEWEPALEALYKAHSLDTDNRTYTNSLGYTLARCGRHEQALEVFGRTVGEARAYYNVGRMCRHLGRHDLARQYLRRAAEGEAGLSEARELLARLDAGTPAGDQAVQPAEFETQKQ